jgi:hypothetical protein
MPPISFRVELAALLVLASAAWAAAALAPKSEQDLCAESDLVAWTEVTELGKVTTTHYRTGGEIREYDVRLSIHKMIKGPHTKPGEQSFIITRAREAKNFKVVGGVPSFSYQRGVFYLVYMRKGEDGRFYPTWWNGVIPTHRQAMNTKKKICSEDA